MKYKEYIDRAWVNFEKAGNIMKLKAKDYANDADPFANFRTVEILGLSLQRGILVRVLDKISRINNLLNKEPDVKDESIEDTLLDAINYLNIILISIQEKNNDRKKEKN